MPATAGYSLLNLLITVTIAGILTGVAWPGFANLILDLRMTAAINQFVHGIHLAKQTARTTLRETTLCKSPDGEQCLDAGEWHDGWLMFANIDEEYPPHVDATDRVIEVNRAWASGEITANRRSFTFRPFEIRSTNGTLIFCDRRGPAHARAVIVSYTGRPRTYPAAGLGKPFTCAR